MFAMARISPSQAVRLNDSIEAFSAISSYMLPGSLVSTVLERCHVDTRIDFSNSAYG